MRPTGSKNRPGVGNYGAGGLSVYSLPSGLRMIPSRTLTGSGCFSGSRFTGPRAGACSGRSVLRISCAPELLLRLPCLRRSAYV